MYNQRNLLNDLKEEKAIANDAESMKCIKNIERIDERIRSNSMSVTDLAADANEVHDNYARLQQRAEVNEVPLKYQQVYSIYTPKNNTTNNVY